MRIKSVLIEETVKQKILEKHGVEAVEIKNILLSQPLILKSKFNRYLAIGFHQRCLTIVFEYSNGTANIITAYPSSDAQIKWYRKKKN